MNLTAFDFVLYGVSLLLLLFINAMLVVCEISMVKVRYSLLDDEEMERLRQSRRVARLLDRGGQIAQVLRFGVLVTTVGLGLVLVPTIFFLIGSIEWFSTQPGKTLLVFFTFVLTVSLTSIFGFLVPRGIALAYPRDSLRFSSWFILGFITLVTPWSRILRRIAGLILQPFQLKLREDFNVLDYEVQIRALGEEDISLSPRIRNLLRNALRIRDLEVSDVLLPRNQVKYMDITLPVDENLAMARESGHTRFPLCEEDLDHCLGLIHIKDIFRRKGQVSDLMRIRRNILSFDEADPLEKAMETMLQQKFHMAVVKDEFGGTLGLITLEGILEVLVGDIQDEFDITEAAMVRPMGKEAFHVDGLTPLHDLEEALEINVGDTEAATFGGWITDELGRMPDAGESFTLDEPPLAVTILEVDEKRILSATVRVRSDDEDEE
ncbi:MAG: hemolysin family protein [Verrucomicrobiota bacterium JB024]|nr:hemolysin family protein [Verrucomicrobiota bacterium JB024]